jgi:hypothetical protein
MGEAKRRKTTPGENYGTSQERIFSWSPITKNQAKLFVEWSTRGAWFGIGGMVVIWIIIRFIGPAFGWWEVV